MIENIFAHIVSKYSEKIAVYDGERRFTYRELYIQEQRFVKYLKEGLRIRRGEKIALFLPNCTEFIFIFFAVAEIGAIAVPLNIHLKEKELQYYIDRCDITVVITDSALLSQWGEIPSKVKKVKFILIDQLVLPTQDVGIPSQISNSYLSNGNSLDTEVLYISTSGSTGRPKIIPKTHSNLITGAENFGKAISITSQDKFLSVAPFFHANGFDNCMFLPITKGASIILTRQFSPRGMLRLFEEEITILNGSPFVFSTLSEVADKTYCFSTIRLCLSTGAPMPKDLSEIFLNKFGVKVREHYGSSETGPISVQLGDLQVDKGSVGKPLDGVEVKVVGEDGRRLPPYKVGEILVSSPSMTKGYVGEPQLNEETFQEGYVRTGDLGMLDRHGNLYISGRKNLLINAAGVKIDPVEIQNVLLSFPKVKDAVVYGVKNKRGMEIVKAIIVARPGCKTDEVIAFCKDEMADYKVPRIIEFRDKIPRDVAGKVVWSQIRQSRS